MKYVQTIYLARTVSTNKDGTEYTLISDRRITVTELDGEEVIKIAPEALTLLARAGIL